jgi:hypothetical protein
MPKRNYNWPGVKPDNSTVAAPRRQARQVRTFWRYTLSFSSGPDVS